jgi:hypothetical protein
MRRLTAVVAAAALALAAAGCEKTLDEADAEDLARQAVEADPARGAVSSQECPDDIEPKDGESFDCTVETAKSSFVVTIELSDVTDDGANMTVTDIQEG